MPLSRRPHTVTAVLNGSSNMTTYEDISYDTLVTSFSNERIGKRWFPSNRPFFVAHGKGYSQTGHVPRQVYAFSSGYSVEGDFVYNAGQLVDPHTGHSPLPYVPQSWNSEQSILNSHGPDGYAKSRPGKPLANLSYLAAITHEQGVPRLPFSRAMLRKGSPSAIASARNYVDYLRHLGDEYLNVVFGWLPLLRDLRALYNAQKRLEFELLKARLRRGKVTKTRRTLVNSTTNNSTSNTYKGSQALSGWSPTGLQVLNLGNRDVQSTISVCESTDEHIWFAGSWSTNLLSIQLSESQWRAGMSAYLLTGGITPKLLYDLIPWTWLIDWFSNVGDYISNMTINPLDYTVSTEAAVMRTYTHSKITTAVFTAGLDSTTASWQAKNGGVQSPVILTSLYYNSMTTKSRLSASPFGFGVSFSGLSTGKLATLAALGLSRANFPT